MEIRERIAGILDEEPAQLAEPGDGKQAVLRQIKLDGSGKKRNRFLHPGGEQQVETLFCQADGVKQMLKRMVGALARQGTG